MRTHAISTLVSGALLTLAAAGAVGAQERDARVTPFGSVRLEAAGVYTRWDARFGTPGASDATRMGLGTALRVRIGPENVAPLAALQSDLNRAFEATEATGVVPGFRAAPDDAALGTTDIAYGLDRVVAPMALEVGVLPRVSVRVGTSVVQHAASLRRYALEGGLVGVNPDAAYNRGVLARIDPGLEGFGGGTWLPTAGSPAGVALQGRVRSALDGDTLHLPARAALPAEAAPGLAAAGIILPALRGGTDAWQLEAAEAGIRVQLFDNVGGAAPAAGGFALRAALGVAASLPLLARQDVANPLLPAPERGHAAAAAHIDADAFTGRHLWTTASVSYVRRRSTRFNRAVLDAGSLLEPPSVRTVEHAPGDVLQFEVRPRVRFADALALGLSYRVTQLGAERWTDVNGDGASVALAVAARSVQHLGVGLRYSTLPAIAAGAGALPIEAHVGIVSTLSGAAGEPAARSVEMSARVYHRIWGR
jgi:hypothetical protein